MRELKDYLIYKILEIKSSKDQDPFDKLTKIASLFKDKLSAYSYIEWWIYDNVEKNIYLTEPVNQMISVDHIESFVNFLLTNLEIGD